MHRKYVAGLSLAVLGTLAVVTVASRFASDVDTNAADQRIEAEREAQRPTQLSGPAGPATTEQPTAGATQPAVDDDQATLALRNEQLVYLGRLDAQIQILERQIDDLEVTARAAPSGHKAEYAAALLDVRLRRDALKADVASMSTATVATWDPMKTRIDLDLQDLDRSVRTASTRIKNVPRQPSR